METTMLNQLHKWFAIAAVFACADSLQATSLDPIGLAGRMPGSSWKQVMKEFRRLDTDDNGRLSRDERNLYHIQDSAQESLPPKWTAGVNLIWEDRVFTRAEFGKLLATLRSLPPGQQAAARRSWLASRKRNRRSNKAVFLTKHTILRRRLFMRKPPPAGVETQIRSVIHTSWDTPR